MAHIAAGYPPPVHRRANNLPLLRETVDHVVTAIIGDLASLPSDGDLTYRI